MTMFSVKRSWLQAAVIFLAGLVLSGMLFYVGMLLASEDISLLLPYVAIIAVVTFTVGNLAGTFFSLLSLALWAATSSRFFTELTPKTLLNFAIKGTSVLVIFALFIYINKLNDNTKKLAIEDALCGLNNRRGFSLLAAHELRRLKRSGNRASLIFIDIDNFKRINDKKGHKEGDAVLRELARIIMLTTRSIDISARIGGDEFCILLPEVDMSELRTITMRLVDSFEASCMERAWPASLSIGAFTTNDVEDLDRLIAQGDALMYAAKGKGKGRIEYGLAS